MIFWSKLHVIINGFQYTVVEDVQINKKKAVVSNDLMKNITSKVCILLQSFVSGIGNWIADEVLYQVSVLYFNMR